MIKIDRISTTKRGRYALFADGEFLFSVDELTLLQFHIQEGSSFTDGELSSLKSASDTQKSKDAALRYLSLRAHGEQELYDKLCRKYDEHSSAAAVAAMRDVGLLDDESFAIEKAKGMAGRGKSSFEIRHKLQSLGIDRALIDEALAQSDIDEEATALRLVEKSYLEKLRGGEEQKVKAALARHGFSYATIREAIRRAREEHELDGGHEPDYY